MDRAAVEGFFAPFGPVSTRRMFGGHAVYAEGFCFALVIGGEAWLKSDPAARAAFEAAGSRPFSYGRKAGGTTVTSYWSLPEPALDDEDALRAWCGRALEAARRTAADKAGRLARRGSALRSSRAGKAPN